MRLLSIVSLAGLIAVLPACTRRPPSVQPLPVGGSLEPMPNETLATYVCRRARADIVVDGVLNDEAWEEADLSGPFSLWNGQPATQPTEARLLWDDGYLYLGVQCDDPDIQGSMGERDQNLWQENEVVELFADANGDQLCYLEFEINPLNTVLDLIIPEAGGGGSLVGKKCWDAKGLRSAVVKESAARLGEYVQWTVEMAIPLEDFLDAPTCPPEEGDTWRINLYRVDQSGDEVEYQAWCPTNTDEPNFHVPERFGILEFRGGVIGKDETG